MILTHHGIDSLRRSSWDVFVNHEYIDDYPVINSSSYNFTRIEVDGRWCSVMRDDFTIKFTDLVDANKQIAFAECEFEINYKDAPTSGVFAANLYALYGSGIRLFRLHHYAGPPGVDNTWYKTHCQAYSGYKDSVSACVKDPNGVWAKSPYNENSWALFTNKDFSAWRTYKVQYDFVNRVYRVYLDNTLEIEIPLDDYGYTNNILANLVYDMEINVNLLYMRNITFKARYV